MPLVHVNLTNKLD